MGLRITPYIINTLVSSDMWVFTFPSGLCTKYPKQNFLPDADVFGELANSHLWEDFCVLTQMILMFSEITDIWEAVTLLAGR